MDSIIEQFRVHGRKFYPWPAKYTNARPEYLDRRAAYSFANYCSGNWAGELCYATRLEF